MSQHIPPQTTYIHYPVPGAPPTCQPFQSDSSQSTHPSLQHQHQYHHLAPASTLNVIANGSTSHQGPLVATGDWTKDLVHLAKTAELKKHALTLQLHTAHILSAHATLEHKSKTIQDIREQKNKLDSERARLLNSLREINEDRDKADLMEASINKDCDDLRRRIELLADGEYADTKDDVDRLRQELGQPPLPSLQETLEERKTQYLSERRLNAADPALITIRRTGLEASTDLLPTGKRPRGRPKGSKNRAKSGATSEAPPASSS